MMQLKYLALVAQLLQAWSGFLVVAYQHQHQHRNIQMNVLNETIVQPCHVCETDPALLRKEEIPLSWATTMNRRLPNFLRVNTGDIDGSGISKDDRANWTCGEWEVFASSDESVNGIETTQCHDLVEYLERQCCDEDAERYPPIYKCESAAKHALLHPATSGYDTEIAPLVGGAGKQTLQVGVQVEAYNVEVVDHGVDGGAISLTGRVHLSWVDERLKFQNISAEMGCKSFQVKRGSIWTPRLKGDKDTASSEKGQLADLPDETMATVLADGRVIDSFWGRATLRCHTLPRASKECILIWQDTTGNRNVNYVADGGNSGVLVHNLTTLHPSGYNLNRTATALTMYPDKEVGHDIQRVQLTMRFDPLQTDCNVCGDDIDTRIYKNVTIPSNLQWLTDHRHTENWTCNKLDVFLTDKDVGDPVCELGRAFFEEPCCDDSRNNFECESNVHDILTDTLNTITPPDPSVNENDTIAANEDFVDVIIGLDIVHVLTIDVKTNTIEVLVGLELEWWDKRLSWEPFLGGCHRASFRASLDKELTDIWVPNLELVNMREGVNNLPDATASVLYNGKVMWRRNGILSATCEFGGISSFPFDTSVCALEFGGIRDPLFHRVKYNRRPVDYSDSVKNKETKTQEYQLDTDLTKQTNRTEKLTGFDNEIIRYEFSFTRAEKYYKSTFVVLYIFFTLLSFGMFFIDYRLGERLGYGTSMLFVIVAQDITMAELTPITNQILWINMMSTVSKYFVIAGIVQSITIIYIFNFDDDKTEAPTFEETIGFLENAEEGPKQKDTLNNPESHSEQPKKVRNSALKKVFVNVVGVKNIPNKTRDSVREIKRKKLLVVDKITAIIFFLSYAIFILVACLHMVDP